MSNVSNVWENVVFTPAGANACRAGAAPRAADAAWEERGAPRDCRRRIECCGLEGKRGDSRASRGGRHR